MPILKPGLEEHTLYIRDLSGKLIRMINGITSNEVEIFRDDLKPGYYTIEISGPSRHLGKLIVK